MRQLSDVYESARVNIPAQTFPERDRVPAWDALEAPVHAELEALKHNVLSVVGDDASVLASHHRVIGLFNKGLRAGYFAAADEQPDPERRRQKAFGWGWDLALQSRESRGGLNPGIFSQFITATHLLAYEFGQLGRARSGPREFFLRAVGPERAREFGPLVFALPVLAAYRSDLVDALLDPRGFDFAAFYAERGVQPSHVEYLEEGLVALFDPADDRWVKAACCFRLAVEPFADGCSLRDEDFQAPVQAAEIVAARPLTSRGIVRRQLERIALARRWVGDTAAEVERAGRRQAPVSLWDVYALTPAARIRGGKGELGDLIAHEAVGGLSAYLEGLVGPEETRFAVFRRHLPAFAHGFDPGYEAAVGPRVMASVRRGAQFGEGLRRFSNGEAHVGEVLEALRKLGETVRRLDLAAADPVEYVMDRLAENHESPVAAVLHDLLERYPRLAEDLFREHSEFEFFSTTVIRTDSPFDLLRGALFHVAQAVKPGDLAPDVADAHLREARSRLSRLATPPAPVRPRPGAAARPGYRVVLTRETAATDGPIDPAAELRRSAAVLLECFDVLGRILRSVLGPLHLAYCLGKRQEIFDTGYLEALQREGYSSARI